MNEKEHFSTQKKLYQILATRYSMKMETKSLWDLTSLKVRALSVTKAPQCWLLLPPYTSPHTLDFVLGELKSSLSIMGRGVSETQKSPAKPVSHLLENHQVA